MTRVIPLLFQEILRFWLSPLFVVVCRVSPRFVEISNTVITPVPGEFIEPLWEEFESFFRRLLSEEQVGWDGIYVNRRTMSMASAYRERSSLAQVSSVHVQARSLDFPRAPV